MFSTLEFMYGTQRAAAVTTELAFKRGELDKSRELSQETEVGRVSGQEECCKGYGGSKEGRTKIFVEKIFERFRKSICGDRCFKASLEG